MGKQPKDAPFYNLVSDIIAKIPRVGTWGSSRYKQFWNPANYAIVGGVGVVINYFLFFVLLPYVPWFVCNALAIIGAWSWNWLNSVGPLGWAWGFYHKPKNKRRDT